MKQLIFILVKNYLRLDQWWHCSLLQFEIWKWRRKKHEEI